ncbi:IS1634 family transposase [Mycoplasma sp. AC157]|uniref:IS1634 family transposase n=1 Tax=Mycoplasma sp. 480 TaxID=3440155 RepID=UPI003F5145DF
MEKKNLILFNVSGNKKGVIYKYVGWTTGFGKAPTRWFSLGNLEKLLEKKENAVEILKEKLKSFSSLDKKERVQSALLEALESDELVRVNKNVGYELIEELLNKHNIFESFEKTRHKEMKKIFNFLVAKRIYNPSSIFSSFSEQGEFNSDISASKNSFYRLLDIVENNQANLVNALHQMVLKETNRNLSEIYFDSSTVYFESFQIMGYRQTSYSKDGKFKEDQIVIALACDGNGVPFHIKVFSGNTPDSKTMIEFLLELEQMYKIKNITVIADRGMSTSGNIRFLEQKGYGFIISYKAKASSKEFKEYVLNEKDYVYVNDNLKYKSTDFLSAFKNKRVTKNVRRRIVTISKSRALKDREDRQNLINNFKKKQNKDGTVDSSKMLGTKKCKYFTEISKLKFELDYKKIQRDEEFDGVYVYETNLLNLSESQIIHLYSKQWQIESNFRSLKSYLAIRPTYVYLDSHIVAHTLLCFASLVVLKLFIHKTNEYYFKHRINNHLTEWQFIKILSLVREEIFINNITGEEIERKREKSGSDIDLWNKYDEIKKIVIKSDK